MATRSDWTVEQKRAWEARLWFAKEFGWKPDDLENISAEYCLSLIRVHNMKINEENHRAKAEQAKKKVKR